MPASRQNAKPKLMIAAVPSQETVDLEKRLQRLGYDLLSKVDSPHAAAAQAEKECPDLILMDITVLGEMNAFEAAEFIRTHFDAPVVFITTQTKAEKVKRTNRTQPLAYLLKPFEDRELRSTIEAALSAAKAEAWRRKAEHALAESERNYRFLLNNIRDLVFVHEVQPDGLPGPFLEVNDAACETLGYTREELLTRSPMTLDDPATISDIVYDVMKKLATDGLALFESVKITKDGRRIPVENQTRMLEQDGRKLLVTASRDITERKLIEEQLRESQRLYAKAEQMGNFGHWERDFVKNTGLWSEGMYSIFGVTPGYFQSTYEYFLKRVHPADIEHLQSSVRFAISHRQPLDVEYRIIRPDGEERVVRSTAEPRLDESGQAVALFGICQDITERKLAQKAIQESEARYRAIIESQTELISRFRSDGTLTFVNEAYCRYFGEDPADLIGHRFWEHLPPEDQHNFKEYLKNFSKKKPVATIEHRVIDHKAEVRWQQWVDRAIFDEQGRIVEFQAAGRDITERKEIEEALQRSEQQFRSLFDTMSEMVVLHELVYDSSGQPIDYRILECNPAFTAITGIPPQRACGALATLLYDSNEAPYLDIYARVVASGQSEHFETFYRPMNKHFSIAVFAIGPGRFATVTNDITERKLAEQTLSKLEVQMRQAQKLEAIGTLAGGIAHDFNNILGIISGYTELTLMGIEKGTQQHDHLKEIFGAAKRARDLVRQILAFSRQTDQELKPVQVNLIAKEALKFLRTVLPKTIEITEHIQSDSFIMADPTQIHQLLMNLCTNAEHAMREQGGVLEVSLHDVEFHAHDLTRPAGLKPGHFVHLAVTDTGHGMDQDVLQRIFDPYFTTKGVGEGTGLGLSVVHGIAETLGGAVTVYSSPGEGSRFHVYLPRTRAEIIPRAVELEALPTGSETILLVDDEVGLVTVGKHMLEKLGYHVVTMTSGIEALEAFRAQPDKFDLIITDQTMPHMTGMDLAKEFLGIRPDIPVILCTGFSNAVTHESIESAGIRRLLFKPLLIDEVAKVIRDVLNVASRKRSKSYKKGTFRLRSSFRLNHDRSC